MNLFLFIPTVEKAAQSAEHHSSKIMYFFSFSLFFSAADVRMHVGVIEWALQLWWVTGGGRGLLTLCENRDTGGFAGVRYDGDGGVFG